jgi:hypothetical protein
MPSLQLEIIARDEARREARTTFTVVGSDSGGRPELASTLGGFPVARMTFEDLGVPAAQRSSDVLVRFRPVPGQSVESGRLSFSVPTDAFAHTNPRATIRLEARLANGEPLPPWIAFNSVTGRLSGTAPEGFQGVLQIRVTARDQQGLEATTEFTIELGRMASTSMPADQPAGAAPKGGDQDRSGTEEVAPERSDEGAADGDAQDGSVAAKQRDERAQRQSAKRGAPGFADQLRAVREVRRGAIDLSLLERAPAAKAAQRHVAVAAK